MASVFKISDKIVKARDDLKRAIKEEEKDEVIRNCGIIEGAIGSTVSEDAERKVKGILDSVIVNAKGGNKQRAENHFNTLDDLLVVIFRIKANKF